MEYLDIVDENDQVIGQASKDDIYRQSLRHRIVHVLIFIDDGKMVLQKRSNQVSFCPNHWSTAVGGHVQAGENYEKAAIREYQEELGTNSNLELIGKAAYSASDSPNKFLTIFKTQFNGPFKPDPTVVSEIGMFDMVKIKNMINNGDKFHPELIFILKKYYL